MEEHFMKNVKGLFIVLLTTISSIASAQSEKRWIKHRIATLAGTSMHGRGYVNKGGEKAANYLMRQLKEFDALPFGADSSYFQTYYFSVNTFPGNIFLKINKKELVPGPDYIVDAGSTSYNTNKIKLKKIDLAKVKDSVAWADIKAKFKPEKAYFLKNADTVTKYLKYSIRTFANQFPKGLFIVSKPGKLTWIVRTDTLPSTIVYVEDSVLPKKVKTAAVQVENKFIPSFKTQNVLGYFPGTEQPDSFIVFTAHYDHLGRMGRNTIFPGAHDNASGTSLVLYLASYFANHPQRYSVAFMFFSGEEAGLLGSKHYAQNPVFPLSNIRFVVNLDMTGDATNGITVVNGDVQKTEVELLNNINQPKNYIPKIVPRSQTQNSDHYSFSQAGVPAIFIYANGDGTKPYYHDVFDVSKEIELTNIDGLTKLLIDFTGALSGTK